MDVSVVSTLMTGTATIISSIVNIFMQKKVEKSILPERQIWNKTLTEVLVPLINILEEINAHTWDEKRQTMLELLNQKQILIPPEIESLMKGTLNASETTRDDRQETLLKVVESYAHGYRKNLKYPYGEEKIDSNHIPYAEKKRNIKFLVLTTLFSIFAFCNLCIAGLCIYTLINKQPIDLLPWCALSMFFATLSSVFSFAL